MVISKFNPLSWILPKAKAQPAPTSSMSQQFLGSLPTSGQQAPPVFGPQQAPPGYVSPFAPKTMPTGAPASMPPAQKGLYFTVDGKQLYSPSGLKYDAIPAEQAPGYQASQAPSPVIPQKPQLTGDDFKQFYGDVDVNKAQTERDAARTQEQSAFEATQKSQAALIDQSQNLFNELYKGADMTLFQKDARDAFAKLKDIDARQAADEFNLKQQAQQKGTVSWAAAGQLKIINEKYNVERAGAATTAAIAQNNLDQALNFADRAYTSGLNVLDQKMKLVENTLKRATTLSDQEKEDYKEVLDRAKELYDSRKAEQKDAISTYLQLAQKGVQGLNPSMSIEEMTKVAGPELVRQAQEDRKFAVEGTRLDQLAKKVSIAKTQADINKITTEIKNEAVKLEALRSDDLFKVLLASAGGKNPTDSFKNSFEKGVNVVFQIADLQDTIKDQALDPIWGIVRSANPYDTKAQQIKAQLTAIVPNLARGIYGEVGVLTDNDIKIYSQTLPNLKSTSELANALLGITIRSVQRSLETKLRVQAGAGVDVSGQEYVYKQVKDNADRLLGIAGLDKSTDTSGTTPGGLNYTIQ